MYEVRRCAGSGVQICLTFTALQAEVNNWLLRIITKLCGRHTYTTQKKSRSESEMGKLSDQAEEMSENCPKEVKARAKSYMWH